eukprot:TRINITY_DN2527_c0_g1_i1.p1 TRINITY_DN2527_c0_g1~~TRINITY_DN2527_c0_g1_i1.p1  ORF type:complete len:297 (-),score=94.92 TRINITY_DN2527_c0_g1_i1:74-964(-)
MSSVSAVSASNLTIQADGYTHAAAALLVVDFLLVQTHFWTMLKHDPSAQTTGIRVLSFLAILGEFLVLTPLFFLNAIDQRSGLLLVLVPLGFSLVDFFCYLISLIKTWMIHARMVSEGRVVSYDTNLKVATGLIVVGVVGSPLLGGFASLLKFIGFVIYLHVLNVLRKSNAPRVTARMFWAQIASIGINVLSVVLIVAMVFAVASGMSNKQNNSDSDFESSTSAPELTEDDVVKIWSIARGYFLGVVVLMIVGHFVNLLTTGHYIGDACGQRPHYLNFSEPVEAAADDEEFGAGGY